MNEPWRWIITAANEVCEGYVFSGVCLSTRGRGLCPGRSLSRGSLLWGSLSREGSLPGRGLCPGRGPCPGGLPYGYVRATGMHSCCDCDCVDNFDVSLLTNRNSSNHWQLWVLIFAIPSVVYLLHKKNEFINAVTIAIVQLITDVNLTLQNSVRNNETQQRNLNSMGKTNSSKITKDVSNLFNLLKTIYICTTMYQQLWCWRYHTYDYLFFDHTNITTANPHGNIASSVLP